MAYAALVSLAGLLEQILHDRFFYIPRSDEEQKLESLQGNVSFLQAFLDNYSHEGGKTNQSLEVQIRDAVYQAQDIIEYHISDRIQSDYDCCGVKRGLQQLVSSIRKVERRKIRNEYGEDLLKALEQIESIVKDVMTNCRVEEVQISHTSSSAISSSRAPNGDDKMVGFDEDLIRIKEWLCGESSKRQIISIVGMGGIGKTTLARNIFDDSLIVYHFHTRAWITISQEYNLREILLALLDSFPVTTKDLSRTNEELMEDVYKSLKGRTYLIIMDDMWSAHAWDDLRRIFPDDNNGSRVVITTRLTDVAEYASSSCIHHMHFLNEDQSWNLLQEKVFAEKSCPKELENTGRIISKNCGGLPLAIAVVAGILTKVDRTQYHWKNIAGNISSAMATTDEHFSKILTLSYDHLPNHLKACFLYLGSFPEDYEIPASKLVMLWVAEGFLKPIASKSLEEAAEEYLEDLVRRNLVLITKKSSNGRFKFCGMHDLLRDLCIQIAQEEKFLEVVDRNANTSRRDMANMHRLRIFSDASVIHMISKINASPIRSVLYFVPASDIFSFVIHLRLLRVLDVPNIDICSLPAEMTELYHLRYLAFAYYSFNGKPLMLPSSISKLRNLQTLIIHSLPYILPSLPFQIWKLPQLRHFIMFTSVLHIPLAARIRGRLPVLENLQTLSGVANFKLTRKALDMIPNLKKLKVIYTDVSEAKCSRLCLNNLVHLQQLEVLNLEFIDVTLPPRLFCPVSYALPLNLKKLTLKGCRPPSEDMSIIGSLPNLEVLKLNEFAFVEGYWESNEEEFSRLKFLLIEQSNLIHWRAESTHFPCLQHLVIRRCPELDEIPGGIGDITSLELIEVGPYSKSAADSAVLMLEEQRSLGNDILQIRLYP